MAYNISNHPTTWDTREVELSGVEFFENWDYKQIALVWVVVCKDWLVDTNRYSVAINTNDTDLDYDTIKAMSMCEFNPIANVVKAEACEWVKTYLVTEFDALGLFD